MVLFSKNFFGQLNIPINVFGNSPSSPDNSNKTDARAFVQKPFLRTSYFESNIEGDIDMKNQFKVRNLPCAIEISDAVCKSFVASGLNDPSIIRNTAHVDSMIKILVMFVLLK